MRSRGLAPTGFGPARMEGPGGKGGGAMVLCDAQQIAVPLQQMAKPAMVPPWHSNFPGSPPCITKQLPQLELYFSSFSYHTGFSYTQEVVTPSRTGACPAVLQYMGKP